MKYRIHVSKEEVELHRNLRGARTRLQHQLPKQTTIVNFRGHEYIAIKNWDPNPKDHVHLPGTVGLMLRKI